MDRSPRPFPDRSERRTFDDGRIMELERAIKISNRYGLHARASTRLAQLAQRFRCDVYIAREGTDDEVDGKSILGILTLGAEKGQTLMLRVSGDDARDALEALVGLIENNFGEDAAVSE